MKVYKSLSNSIRDLLEGKMHTAPDGGPETDMNDQVAVGSYQTKAFEMSNAAQKLYSNLPKDTPIDPAMSAAVHLDKLFHIDKSSNVRGHASKTDLVTAHMHASKVRSMAKQMNLDKEHDAILKTSLDNITKRVEKAPKSVISPDEHKHPSDDSRFNTPSKEYKTDRTNDRDTDNVKNFLLKRSLTAQRKIKIIDND
jgi:hypothetical protein